MLNLLGEFWPTLQQASESGQSTDMRSCHWSLAWDSRSTLLGLSGLLSLLAAMKHPGYGDREDENKDG